MGPQSTEQKPAEAYQEKAFVATVTKEARALAGKKVGKGLLSKDALRACGLDWEVKKVPLFLKGGKPIPDRVATIRTDTDGYLGCVGSGWEPVQNLQAFEFMDSVFGKVPNLEWVQAGEFKGGKLVFLQLKTGQVRVKGDDTVDQVLTFTNWHDGHGAVRVTHTPIRLACQNQLPAIIRNAADKGVHGSKMGMGGDDYRFAHTLNVNKRLEEAERIMTASSAYFKAFFERARFLAGEDVPGKKWVDEFLLKLEFNASDKFDKKGEKTGESVKDRRREKVIELFETGRGNQLPGVKGTVWALYNGVTEYLDHYAEVKKGGYSSKDEARQYASAYGHTRRLKERAFDVAVEMAGKLS